MFIFSFFNTNKSKNIPVTQNNYFIFAQKKQALNKLNRESISTIQIILFFINPMLRMAVTSQ